MIQRNQKKLNRLNVLSDGVLIVLCYLFASWLWLDVIKNKAGNMAALSSLNARGVLAAVIYAVWTVFLLTLFRVYHTSRVHRSGRESARILAGNAIALATAASALFLFRLQDFSRGVLGVYFLSSSAVLIGKRKILRFLLRCMRARGYNLKHMLVVGGGKLAERYVQNVKAEPSLGIHVEQCLIPSEGMLEKLESRLHGAGIDEVILALAPDELRVTADVIQVCEKCGTKISVVPFYNDVIPTRPDARPYVRAVQQYRYPAQSQVWGAEDRQALGIRAYHLSDVCSAYRRSAYKTVGGFPHPLPTNEDMLIAAAFLDSGYRLAYCADAAVVHSHDLTLRQEYRRNVLIGRFLQEYGERLGHPRETGEGMRMVRQVLSQLLRSGHPLECLAFAADCAARLLGSRMGRRAETGSQRRIRHAADG